MCGGHGLWRLFPAAAQQPGQGHHQDGSAHDDTQRGDVESAVKTLYARGEIDRGTFQRLMEMAQAGYLTHADLASVRRATSSARKGVHGPERPETASTEEKRLRETIRLAEENARRVTTDEERRAFLEIKQGAQYRLEELERSER